MMECYVHPGVSPVGSCVSCGRSICKECAVEAQNKLVCKQCLAEGKMPAQAKEVDPNTAFLVELVGGFFGLMGLGYIYVGRTNDGILRLVLWMLFVGGAWFGITLLSAVLIGLICIPIQILIQIGVPVWSAMTLKNELLAS